MMRSIIIGLSVIFFSLSVIVILLALEIPSRETPSQGRLPEIAFAPLFLNLQQHPYRSRA